MTLLLPMNVTNLYTPLAIIEGDQCLEDESYFCDEWSTSADFDFLETCTNSTEDVYPVKDACQGIKRKHLEDSPAGGNSTGNILEQQRLVHKLSFEKLRKLEDPESCLRRSVLINNTLKYLHTQIYPVETPCYEFYTGFNPSDHHRMNISPLVRKRSLTNIQTEVVQQSSINSDTNSTEMQVPELSNPRGFTTEKHDKNPLSVTLDDEHDSMFCELDNVFRNFICALET